VTLLIADEEWRRRLPVLNGDPSAGTVLPVVLMTRGPQVDILAACAAGVAAFVDQEDPAGELLLAIRSAADRRRFCSRSLCVALTQSLRIEAVEPPPAPAMGRLDALTAQELAVARAAAGGLSNKEIARSLRLQVSTVKTYLHQVYAKLQVESRAQLAHQWQEAERLLETEREAAPLPNGEEPHPRKGSVGSIHEGTTHPKDRRQTVAFAEGISVNGQRHLSGG
jgi:DNA-binding CsgD family transcriptional regulator